MAIYTISQTDDFLSSIDTSDIITAKKRKFYNLPCSFDIETTSFYESSTGVIYTNKEYKNLKNQVQGEKRAVMYVWQFAICDDVIYGRTWQEFISFCDRLHNFLDLENNYLVVYVHNLSYEFQFMCKWFMVASSRMRELKHAVAVKMPLPHFLRGNHAGQRNKTKNYYLHRQGNKTVGWAK